MAKTRNSDSLAFLFDLDGTLIDRVYQHVLAWPERRKRPASNCRSGAFTGRSV